MGCGIIIYYFHEPFEEYVYNTSTKQWKELFRKKNQEWWINNIEIIDDSCIIFENEKFEKYKYDLESDELMKSI